MSRIMVPLVVVALCAALSAQESDDRGNVVISRGFQGRNAYLIVCKGYPKQGAEGLRKRETAKEAALMNAQFIARDIFNESVDPVRNGSVVKFVLTDDHAVVHYRIYKNGLRGRVRRSK